MKKGKLILAYLLMAGILFGNSMSVFATEKTQVAEEKKKEESKEQVYVITGFQELDMPYYEWPEKYSLKEVEQKLPQTLTVTTDKKQKEEIPVTWKCMDDYTNTQLRVYEFLPYWDEEKYLLSNELDEYWDVPYVQVSVPLAITANEQADIDVTRKALSSLLERQQVQAVVCLCESYEVKQKPAQSGKTEVTLSSGATVVITDVAVDEYRNVWYQVSGEAAGKTFLGYIEKKNLAYANEAFREWEEKYAMVFTGYNTVEDAKEASLTADVEQFPASYQAKLMGLKKKHPNWIFVRQNTGLDWEMVTQQEYNDGLSTIDAEMGDAYKEKYCGPGMYYATKQAVCYYMDPRNFMDDTSIFQFEQLTFNPSYHSKDAIENILMGTFMEGKLPDEDMSYAGAIYKVGSDYEVSPFYLLSRMCQAEGILVGQKEGGDGSYQTIASGADFLLNEYILKGQDTLYLQKYNVAAESKDTCQHQYTKNISAPYKEAFRIKAAYEKAQAEDNIFVFKIPVYENMPKEACPVPRKSPIVTATVSEQSLEATDKATEAPAAKQEAEAAKSPVTEQTAKFSTKTVEENAKEQIEQLKQQLDSQKNDSSGRKTVVLDTTRGAVVYAQTLKVMKEQDIQMQIPVHDNITWLIDGARILSDALLDIDFTVTVGESRIPENKISDLTTGTADYVELSLAHEGVFGFDAVFEIKLPQAKRGQYANLFYYNEQNNVMEFVCAAPINQNQEASFTFIHASEYVIIISDSVMEKVIFKVTEEQMQKQQQLKLAETRAEMLLGGTLKGTTLKTVGIIAGILVVSMGTGLVIRQKCFRKNKKEKK